MSGEVVVVGAGVVGAATSYFLAEKGARVTLLDARSPGWGASGRNPGFVWLHLRAEGPQLDLAMAGRRLYDRLVPELDDFEFRASGGMIYFFDHHGDVFGRFVEERRKSGLPLELLDRAEARRRCPILPERVAGATFNPLDGHVHPQKLVRALVAGAERAGVRVLPDSPVSRLAVSNGRCTGAVTEAGPIEGDAVVLAAGAWTAALLEPLGLPVPIVPMRLQVMETKPVPQRFTPILYGPTAVKQYDLMKQIPGFSIDDFTHPLERSLPDVELLELVAQRKDGRLLLGCPMDFPGMDDRTTVSGIGLTLAVLADHLPALRGAPLARTWAGLLPETPDALPILGPAPGIDGLFLATGHVFGMSAGAISGQLVAELVSGEPTALDLSPFRYEREGLHQTGHRHGRW